MDYVIEIVRRVFERRHAVAGVEITRQPPVLRHFQAHFRQLGRTEPMPAGFGS
jgi:tryptophanase